MSKTKHAEACERYRKRNPELIKIKSKEYYELKLKGHYKSKPTIQTRNAHYRHKYKISLTEYNIMSEKQKHMCAICGCPETTKNKEGGLSNLCVDHDHTTGKVRGLLCRMCNSALGKFKDSSTLLKSALEYLNCGREETKVL